MRLITVLAVGGVTVVASQLICRLYLAAHNRSRMRQATSAAVPVILTKEQQVKQAAKRAALLKRLAALPEHLRLGVTLPGMRELLFQGSHGESDHRSPMLGAAPAARTQSLSAARRSALYFTVHSVKPEWSAPALS